MIETGWYVAAWAAHLAARPIHRRVANTPLVLYRRADGTVVALHDQCPHRAAPLSTGRVEGDDILCAFHGLRVGPDGLCPDLVRQGRADALPRVAHYPVVEQDGLLWVRREQAGVAMGAAQAGSGPPRMPWAGRPVCCDMTLLQGRVAEVPERTLLESQGAAPDVPNDEWRLLTPHTAQSCLQFRVRLDADVAG